MSVIKYSRRSFPYVYKWHKSVDHLLPQHYKDRCREFMLKEPSPVHYRPNPSKYTLCEKTGVRQRVQNVAVDVMFPDMVNKGLWGGEGIIVGLRKKTKHSTRWPKIWRPYVLSRVLYSEILNKHFIISVTPRTLDLIDEHFGLDNYILKTHEVDLCSKLGMDLKRQMLLALAEQSCYPDNPAKREEILAKYKDFIMPAEEAEWVGLSVEEALNKVEEATPEPRPLKDVFMEELAQQLSETSVGKPQEKTFMEKINPFS